MQKNNQMDTETCFKLMAVLFFIFFLGVSTASSKGFREAQTSVRTGSVRPDGKLDFVSRDGTKVVTIVVEIAETAEERSKGLMGRASLPMANGMLFIFEQAELRYFWMSNTPASLDMIFVDAHKQIVHMAESTTPMTTHTYSSQFPARYVVEVPAGFVKFFKIKTGMRIQWQRR